MTVIAIAWIIFQVTVIMLAAHAAVKLCKKLGVNAECGALLAGLLIGPYALGSLPLPGLSQGLFPLAPGSLALKPEIYLFASFASVIALFARGAETAPSALFRRSSLSGVALGVFSPLAAYALSSLAAAGTLSLPLEDPTIVAFGLLAMPVSAATATAALFDHARLSSVEGATTVTAAATAGLIGLAALTLTFALASGPLPATACALTCALGLGAWLAGRSLARPNLYHPDVPAGVLPAVHTRVRARDRMEIRRHAANLNTFLSPLIFAISGMLVDPARILEPTAFALAIGCVCAFVAAAVIATAVVGLVSGFSGLGCLRIGAGLLARADLSLMIAGIGVAAGILDPSAYCAAIFAWLAVGLAAPPLLDAALNRRGVGRRVDRFPQEPETTTWDFGDERIASVIAETALRDLADIGYSPLWTSLDGRIAITHRGGSLLACTREGGRVGVESPARDAGNAKSAVYRALARLNESLARLTESSDPGAIREDGEKELERAARKLLKLVSPSNISSDLQGTTKAEIIAELVDLMATTHPVSDRAVAVADVLAREESMSTGMQRGIALPHGKTQAVETMGVAIGVKKAGVDFTSLDGEPSRLFVLVVSPKHISGPHIQFMSEVGKILRNRETCEKIVKARSAADIRATFESLAKESASD